jgi:hypothetical protein
MQGEHAPGHASAFATRGRLVDRKQFIAQVDEA